MLPVFRLVTQGPVGRKFVKWFLLTSTLWVRYSKFIVTRQGKCWKNWKFPNVDTHIVSFKMQFSLKFKLLSIQVQVVLLYKVIIRNQPWWLGSLERQPSHSVEGASAIGVLNPASGMYKVKKFWIKRNYGPAVYALNVCYKYE